MTDIQLLDAAEAYEDERRLWTVRKNKTPTPTQWEVIRVPDDGDPEVVIIAIDSDVADGEMEEQRGLAAMKAALRVLEQ